MLSAAGGRTPEVWNFPYANPHHGSFVNGNGRDSLAEEGELPFQQGCIQPARNTSALPPRRTVVPLASLDCDRRRSNVSFCGSHYTSEASPQTDKHVVRCSVDGQLWLRASNWEW